MSSGNFAIRFYEADSGEIHLIKQQPESAVFSIGGSPNALPAGPATSPFWAKTNRAKTEYGLRPRKIKFRFNPGEEPAGYVAGASYDVVVYSTATYNNATIGSVGNYLGGAGVILGKIAEDIYPLV
jgi:hypothetical protein